ncbi:MAG: porin family protein [Candidatus Aminicenantales bacterium]
MKKAATLFLILCFTLLTALPLHPDSFKLITGLNLLKYSSLTEENFQWRYKPGFCVGAGFEFDLAEEEILAIEVDAFILQKKGSKVSAENSDFRYIYHLNSLCFPALVRLKAKEHWPFYFLGGGQFFYVLSHNVDIKSGSKVNQIDLKESTKNFGWALTLGGGLERKISKYQKLFIEIRYNLSWLNLLKFPEPDEKATNSALLLMLGIKNY